MTTLGPPEGVQWFIENGERLARIETALDTISRRKPCEECQNVGTLAHMRLNLRVINWIGASVVGVGLASIAKWLIDRLVTHPFQ